MVAASGRTLKRSRGTAPEPFVRGIGWVIGPTLESWLLSRVVDPTYSTHAFGESMSLAGSRGERMEQRLPPWKRVVLLAWYVVFINGGIALYIWAVVLAHQNVSGWKTVLYYIPVWNVLLVTWKAWQAGWLWYVIPACIWLLIGVVTLAKE